MNEAPLYKTVMMKRIDNVAVALSAIPAGTKQHDFDIWRIGPTF